MTENSCYIFPISFFWFPVIYWSIVFLYERSISAPGTRLRSLVKRATYEMFNNTFSSHPSQLIAFPIMMIVLGLDVACMR